MRRFLYFFLAIGAIGFSACGDDDIAAVLSEDSLRGTWGLVDFTSESITVLDSGIVICSEIETLDQSTTQITFNTEPNTFTSSGTLITIRRVVEYGVASPDATETIDSFLGEGTWAITNSNDGLALTTIDEDFGDATIILDVAEFTGDEFVLTFEYTEYIPGFSGPGQAGTQGRTFESSGMLRFSRI